MKDKVTVLKSIGWDDMYVEWFKCPKCTETNLLSTFKFCPDCGAPLDWSKIKGGQ
jgi:hypothetical protein